MSEVPYSIVVAALNEEETIEAALAPLTAQTDDLIVVDGHSGDRTVEIARSCGARVLQDNGRGKGNAVRVGFGAARHPIVVFMDADGSHNPDEIPSLVAPVAAGEADLVIGSRRLGGSEELFGSFGEAVRLFGLVIISLAINYRFGVRLTDYQNGFRAIRTSVARSLDLRTDRTTIEQEMAMRCLARGHPVVEVPTRERRRAGGVSKVNVLEVGHIYVWSLLVGLAQRRRPARAADSVALSTQDADPARD